MQGEFADEKKAAAEAAPSQKRSVRAAYALEDPVGCDIE